MSNPMPPRRSETASSWKRFLFGLLLLFLSGCATVEPLAPLPSVPVGQLLLVGFRGTQVEGNEELRRLVCDLQVGGLILFERDTATGEARNIVDPTQLARLTRDLQALARGCAGRPLLIAVDAEGGLVMRLSPRVGYSPTLSHKELGEEDDLAQTELEARRIGAMLREAGINWNLAPVVDVALNPLNRVIVQSGRAFSGDAERVTAHARAYLHGMRAAGILTTLKHFPGHGGSVGDTHKGFVEVTGTARPETELLPYRALIGEGIVDAVMTAHVFNRTVDPNYPATLSPATLQGLLRQELGFEGVVVSDDLLMGAIVNEYGIEEAALLALQAGVDMLLISENNPADDGTIAGRVLKTIERAVTAGTLSRPAVEDSLARIRRLTSRLPP
jgi:beta-N-acetylhexosaminidase